MESLAVYLPAIACGAMMLLICIPMLLGRKRGSSDDQSASKEEVAALREEITRLRAERAPSHKENVDG